MVFPVPQLFANAKKFFGPLLGLTLFAVALYVLHRELRDYHYQTILADLRTIDSHRVIIAGLLTALSYLVLTLYDVVAVRYVDFRLPYPKIAFASFIAYTLSHNLGFSLFTGGAARFRLFFAWGLSPLQISQAIGFSGLVFWLGFCLLCAFLLLVDPAPLPPQLLFLPVSLRVLGLCILVLPAVVLYLWIVRQQSIRVKDWEFHAPQPNTLLMSLGVSAVDWVLAAGVAYALLPSSSLSFFQFVGVFQLAQIVGLLSHIPGGLGVFESLILIFYASDASKSAVLGALIVYRTIYYLVPLAISLTLFAAYELRLHRLPFANINQKIQTQTALLVPPIFTLLVFVSGVVLLVSGGTPAIEERMKFVGAILPLAVIEFSHFGASLAGIALVVLARGLARRLDAAYILSLGVLCVGVLFSVLKGFDYEEASLLCLVMLLLLPCRSYFYRKASLLSEPLSPSWLLSVGLVLVTLVWLVFFCFKHVEYSGSLWWEFSFLSDAPRSLRALVGVVIFSMLYGVRKLLSPITVVPHLATEEELFRALPFISSSPRTMPALALLGDKSLLFDDANSAFIMYRVVGRSWIALGDPVGEPAAYPELIWRFFELSDSCGAQSIFYQVGAENLHYYVEVGLQCIKLGEEAIVDLETFGLEGKSKGSLRHSRNKTKKEGWKLRILSPDEVSETLPTLRGISLEWLEEKGTREKGFSLGYFDETYLRRFPIAVVERDGLIIAFANIWPGDGRYEMSVDLMRHSRQAPNGIMDFLFLELMFWAKAQGYKRFNLGMAPFSGFDEHKLAPLWAKLGHVIYQRGEKYYNFQGLRHYKDKFAPNWEPRYLAAPGGLDLARTFTNVAALISGGIRGIVTR